MGDRIAELSARIQAAACALLVLIPQFDEQSGWRAGDAYHVRHWAHGGATRLDNLVQLCRRHHRAAHEGGLRVTFDAAGAVRFTRADGRPLPEAPEASRWTGAALAPAGARLAAAGIEIGPETSMPAWGGERLDLDWAIGVLWRPRNGPAAVSPA